MRLLLPIGHHDAVLMFKKSHNVLIGPICIGDVCLHVGTPLLRQGPDESPLFVFGI